MMAIHLATVLIPTQPRKSIDARIFGWIARRPTDVILIVGWVLFGLYLIVYFGTGCWRMPT